MGEMADLVIEKAMENEDEWLSLPRSAEKVCRLCGEAGLHWRRWGLEGWRLFDEEGMLHSCRGHKEARDPKIYTKEEALRLKKDRWIDTSDGLPPCGMEVLVETCEGIITALTRYKKSDGAPVDMSWWDNRYPGCGENVHRVFAVSKWRKLPGKKSKISIEKVGR